MRAIDGMIYGDSSAQGFVRGRNFIHPDLRFRFQVPTDFVITNSAKAVVSRGPNGSRFVLDSGGPAEGSGPLYIQRKWAPALAEKYRGGRLGKVNALDINGAKAWTAYMPMKLNGQDVNAQLTLVVHNNRFYRFTGISRADDRTQRRALNNAVRSFAPMSNREAQTFRPYRIETVTVGRSDTVGGFVRQMPQMTRASERFTSMNGLASPSELRSGDIVKVISP